MVVQLFLLQQEGQKDCLLVLSFKVKGIKKTLERFLCYSFGDSYPLLI